MPADVIVGQDGLKIRYATSLQRILLDDDKLAPFYSDIARKEIGAIGKAFGSSFHIVLKVGDPETSNITLATAITKAEASTEGGQSRYKEMAISPTKRFSAVSVTGSAWRRSMTDTQSFVRHRAEEMDSGLRVLHRALMNTVAGSGYGDRGQVSSVTSTTVVITQKADCYKFRVGMEINAAAAQGTGVVRSGTGRITAVDRSTKTLTVTGVNPSSSSWQANDYLFQVGDFSASVLTNWLGVAFWIPDSVPASSADSSGIDRSSGPELCGHRYSASSDEDAVDALQNAAADFYSAGMTCDAVYVNPIDYGKISRILQVTKRGNLEGAAKGKVAANVGYSYVTLACALGNLPLIADRTFPIGKAYFLTRDSWVVAYDGKEVVAPVDEDGLMFTRAATTDMFTARIVSESQLICMRPGENGVVTSLP
jgi:hypothetical protein